MECSYCHTNPCRPGFDTCSRSCASSRANSNRKLSEETKEKIRRTLQSKYPVRKCPICEKLFRRKQEYCSRSCDMKSRMRDPVQRKAVSDFMKSAPHKGWKSRSMSSYAELFWIDILAREQVSFIREKVMSKKSLGIESSGSYFLDFFFPQLNLDLEIDGSQHLNPVAKTKDDERDLILERNGIHVVRMPWKGLTRHLKFTFSQVEEVLIMVGVRHFESPTSCSQNMCSTLELHPDMLNLFACRI